MYVKRCCLVLLLAFICVVALADIDSSGNKESKPKFQNVSNGIFQLGRICASDEDCHHLGKCVTGTGGKFCKCKFGTSGDFCEKVDECVDNPVKCGTLDDVSCVFDIEKEITVCICDNETKTYVEDEERCMSPCVNYNDCGQHGSCYHKIGNKKFCACELGTSGDYCEIIDQCHNKKVDCGVDNNATCTLGAKGSAYCSCDDNTKGFDYDEKICKDCSGCGGRDISFRKCSYRGGTRICSCKRRYFSNKNGKCEDCKCGMGSYGCKFENGTKICQCYSGKANKDGVCEKCDCGPGFGVSKCEFKDGKKICTCLDGYALEGPNGPCKEKCNATTNPCAHEGKCVQNICNCPKGTSGDMCRTIDDCNGRGKCRYVECLYNITSKEAYCKCEGSLLFDEHSKTCKECNCGSHANNCEFIEGKKTCNCTDQYKDRLGTCTLCSCGGSYTESCEFVEGKKKCNCINLYEDRQGICTLCFCKGASSMYGCKFDDDGNMKCPCLKGYAQQGDECKKCDCGDHGKCLLDKWGSKSCSCDEGYIMYLGKCKECNCGYSGTCSFDFVSGEKVCSCRFGYKEYQGTCKACDCGWNAKCEFNGNGEAECPCPSGYGKKHGECTPCNCDPGTKCTFDTSNRYIEKKTCDDCPEGYADDTGNCRVCDCGVKGSNCSYFLGSNRCQCPQGYNEEFKPYRFFDRTCVEIDGCTSNRCPLSSTRCISKLGNYECVCYDGYEGPHSSFEIEMQGCTDINECLRRYKPCDDPAAVCVNTPGSYRCECRYGYITQGGYEKTNQCQVGNRPWRIASIIIGVSSAVIIIGLIIAILKKYNS